MKRRNTGFTVAAVLLLGIRTTQANPLDVSYTLSGSAGNWTFDFSVANNLGGNQDVYIFGVRVPGTQTGYPGNFEQCCGGEGWNNAYYGGSDITYNNNWEDNNFPLSPGILPGQTLSGFDVVDAYSPLPSSVFWFAYGDGTSPYTGGGNFWSDTNPGFEGVAVVAPEASTWAMLLVGFAGLGFAGTRLRVANDARV